MLPDATPFEVDVPGAGDVVLSRSRPVTGTRPAHVLQGDTQCWGSGSRLFVTDNTIYKYIAQITKFAQHQPSLVKLSSTEN